MKIIAVSDTHSESLPAELLEAVRKADLVVHVGDFTEISVYEEFRKLKDIRAVYGNVDGAELRKILPRQMVIHCEGVAIGLVHGEGAPLGLAERVKASFKNEKVQAIVFGHSHAPMNEVVDGILLFNPGSPTDMIRPPYRSYGVLEVKDGKVKGEIVRLK
jgi:putative phosphoesterase